MPTGSSDVIKMGQIYCSVKAVEYHAAFISPMVPGIPPSIGIKYSGMAIRQILFRHRALLKIHRAPLPEF